MKKSLYFLSLVLASQGFVSFLPAPNGWEESGHNDANGPAPASNPVYGSMELGDVKVNFQSQNSLAAGSFVAAAASLHSYLKGRPKTVEKLAQASLQQMLHGPGALWGNSAPKLVGYKSHEDLTYLNVGISEQPSLSVMPAPASSGRPLAPFPRTSGQIWEAPQAAMPPALLSAPLSPTNVHFGATSPSPVLGAQNSSATSGQFSAAPPPPVPFVPNNSPTNNQTLAPFADFSSNHVNSFKPEDGYGVYESSPGLPESLHPVVLSPSGNQQFDHSQTSTLDTGRQNITEENPDMKSAPPPPPPPPPPVPDSGGGAKSPSTAGEKESGKEGDSRGDLLQAIQKGITLKRVDDSQKTSWAKRQEEEENARRRRREEKKQSKQSELRSEAPKKDSASTTSPDQKSEPEKDIAEVVKGAMAERRMAFDDSDSEDEKDDPDIDEWGEDDSTQYAGATSGMSAQTTASNNAGSAYNTGSATAQSAAPRGAASAKGEPVKKPPQAPKQNSNTQEFSTPQEEFEAMQQSGQSLLRSHKPVVKTSSNEAPKAVSLDPELSEGPSVAEESIDKRLAREKAAQAAAEREKAEKQQPKTAAEIFGVKLRSRPVPAVGVKVP